MNFNGILFAIRIMIAIFALFIPVRSFAISLPCVVQHTLRTNPDILQTIHVLEATNETVRQAQADFYPSIDVNAAYGRERSLNNNTLFEWTTQWRKELGITLKQMLFDGFAARNEELRTMAKTDADAFRVYAESEDIALAASEAYVNILRDQDLIAAAQRNVDTHERLANMIRRRATAGVGRVSDTYQAQSRLARAKAVLISNMSQYNEDMITFQRITGLCPDCFEPPPNPCNLPCDECDAIKAAVGYHPAIKTAVAEIEAARALHRAAFAPNFPRIDLVINTQDNEDLAGVPGPNKSRSALLRLQWNIFRGGKDLARQRETAFSVMAAADVRDKIFREVVEKMSLAWNAVIISCEKFPALLEHKDQATKTAEAFDKLFMVGRTSLFDLLGVTAERYTAEQDFITNKYLNIVAKYRVLNSMGQLNNFLCIPKSRHAKPCYHMVEKAGKFYGPIELDYPCLFGGCCRRRVQRP